MSKNRTQAERRRRKARKRADRRTRGSGRSEMLPRASLARQEAVVAQLAELLEELDPPCTEATAGELAEDAEEVAGHLDSVADSGRSVLRDWPEAPATRELRSVAMEIVEIAETSRRQWAAVARRLDAIARADEHMHLVDGMLVPADHDAESGEDDIIDVAGEDIPY